MGQFSMTMGDSVNKHFPSCFEMQHLPAETRYNVNVSPSYQSGSLNENVPMQFYPMME